MTIEGYFDGTAVRPLEPVDLKPQQKVFIHIPNGDFSDSKNARIQKKLDTNIISYLLKGNSRYQQRKTF